MIVVQKLLEMRDIRKSFGATHALSGVSIDVGSGEVLALLGENGAGKSTLISILGGIVQPDSGTIAINGNLIGSFKDVQAARRHKVAVIHQEIVLVPHLSIAENIFLGREPTTRVGLLDIDQIYRKSKEAVESLGLDLNVEDRVGGLSTAQQQLVEIVKAVLQEARILVMDEPTSSLSSPEVETLFSIVRRLRADGAAIIYISHRIDEIFEISDRVTVIRDGAFVGTRVTAETDPDELVSMMVGRHLSSSYHRTAHVIGDVLMSVEGFSKHGTFEGVSFAVRKGEILGFAGLVGSGRSEIMTALFGADEFDTGTIHLGGSQVEFRDTRQAIALGLAMVPEDRKNAGLVLANSVGFNLALAVTRRLGKGPFVNLAERARLIGRLITQLAIKTSSPDAPMSSLSGGNQQKVVIGKWLATEPRVLILDEPTRGVDIGARHEIYAIIDRLAESGMAVILVSSDMPEIISLCDTVCVVRAGRIVKQLTRDELSQEKIMHLAAGGTPELEGAAA